MGANDGLVSVASLMLGVEGGSNELHNVVLAGVAGLVAGALSMAVGEFVSVSSQRWFHLDYRIPLLSENNGDESRSSDSSKLRQIADCKSCMVAASAWQALCHMGLNHLATGKHVRS